MLKNLKTNEQAPYVWHQKILKHINQLQVIAYLKVGQQDYFQDLFPSHEDVKLDVEVYDGIRYAVLRVKSKIELPNGQISANLWMKNREGSSLIECVAEFANDDTVNPPGDVQGKFSFVVYPPNGYQFPRYFHPHLLTYDNAYTYTLPITHLADATRRAMSFVLSYESFAELHDAIMNPQWNIQPGPFDVGIEPVDSSFLLQEKQKAEQRWFLFQNQRPGSPYHLFGHSPNPGASGDQYRLGYVRHALQLGASSKWADQMRGELMQVESLRRYHFDGQPTVPANASNSVYQFYGLHWTSKNKLGRDKPGFTRGDYHGIESYNLEHFESLTPIMAYYTKCPWLMDLTRMIGDTAMNTLCTHPIEQGGYYGGAFLSHRGLVRPLRVIMQAYLVTKELKYKERVDFILSRVIQEWKPRIDHLGRQAAYGLDMRGQRVDSWCTANPEAWMLYPWQMGLAAPLYTWHLVTGSQDALTLVADWQRVCTLGWTSEDPATAHQYKKTYAHDPSQGCTELRGAGIDSWVYGLLKIPNLPGVDQAKREKAVQICETIDPMIKHSKWATGSDWGPVQKSHS